MVLTGGKEHFAGPILGAVIVWVVRSIVSSYTSYWGATLGIILVIIVMFSPQGILPLLARILNRMGWVSWKR